MGLPTDHSCAVKIYMFLTENVNAQQRLGAKAHHAHSLCSGKLILMLSTPVLCWYLLLAHLIEIINLLLGMVDSYRAYKYM